MRYETLAVILREMGRFTSEWMLTRTRKSIEVNYPEVEVGEEAEENATQDIAVKPSTSTENKATSIKTGCIPCSLGHLGSCSGVLNEAMRFARTDGIESGEVIDRVNICLDELNSLERVDLRPEMTSHLPSWEKDLADRVLQGSRATRHKLESLSSIGDLELLAGDTQSLRNEVGRDWFRHRLSNLTPEQKSKLTSNVVDKMSK
jgi:hypothetical protein